MQRLEKQVNVMPKQMAVQNNSGLQRRRARQNNLAGQKKNRKSFNISKAVVATFALLWVLAAVAADLAELKAQGLVGERADGYLGLVEEVVPAEVSELVAGVNARRRAEYERIAASNNIALSEVEALAGRKTLSKTAPGGWIYVDGWRQK